MIHDIPKPDISPAFTIEDIHKIREWDYDMGLGKYFGKLIRVTTICGSVFEGVGEYDTSALDNPNGIASICVGDYELYENEITGIEVIHDGAT